MGQQEVQELLSVQAEDKLVHNFQGRSVHVTLLLRLINLLFILPEFLDAEDVEFVSVDVRQETVGLSERLALRCASAVSHQIDTVTCTDDTDTDRLRGCSGGLSQETA